MRVMRGSRQGEKEHRGKQEWVGGKGPVLVYCTSHSQTDRQTAQLNTAITAAQGKFPLGKRCSPQAILGMALDPCH